MTWLILWIGLAVVTAWIGFAVVTALAAQARGRSLFGWLLLGILFSGFALLAVLVMERKTSEVTKQPEAKQPRKPRSWGVD